MDHDLYNTAILTLAAGIPHLGTLDNPDGSAEKSARLCGSKVSVQVKLDDQGRVYDFAQEVKACALGQAASAILGQNVIGADLDELTAARDGFRAMVKEGAPPPKGRFAGLGALAAVKDYPQRHQSALLPFEAVVDAVQDALGAFR
ncbi:MAG: iron-sulfur cluster assembly scaffold protein [Robiginitomaculum sp.]|nr:iron-sulfur cluster assembly scaffold protein [Robiginitomaculum sp.]MDQ7078765.1 iron-sulfur cluster assembly scaffold protein [Robiginitomaculum sp.]